MKQYNEELVLRVTEQMAAFSDGESDVNVRGRMPSVDELRHIVELAKSIVFPGYFDPRQMDTAEMRRYFIGVNMDNLYTKLRVQIKRGLRTSAAVGLEEHELPRRADKLASQFIEFLPELKRLLLTDVDAICHSDPAVANRGEVIFCYPVVQAMFNYRMAHRLLQLGVPLIPRIITELAHSATGIDIHPGARIDEYFAIDHGTGVVIGETCVIGKHVTIYQGVTLGAKNFTYSDDGNPVNEPRHPIIEDNVTIYSNASVLGRITIGHDAIIGGNVWVTTDVAPYSRIIQKK